MGRHKANSGFGYGLPAAGARQIVLLGIVLLLQRGAHAQGQNAYLPAQAIAAWQQKMYVHVNKTFFVSGEPLWFSLFNVDALHRQRTDIEKMAFVELYNEKRQPVLQTTIPLENGRGHGSWIIPDTLPTGNYLFRAYTNAMRNEGQNAYFETFVAIVNTTVPPQWNELEKPPAFSVQFFPEGGSLVYGRANNTAIRCMDEYGNGVAARGAIVNQHKDTVAVFTTCCGGRASFNWTPKKEDQYNVVAQPEKGGKQIVAVPQPVQEGTTMAVHEAGSGKLQVNIKSPALYKSQSLFLVAGGVHAVQMQNSDAAVTLSENNLPFGLSNLLLYSAAGKRLASRQWYRRQTDSLAISVQLAQQTFGPRQQVVVDLTTASSSGQEAAGLSISVFRVDSIQGIAHLGMEKYPGGATPSEFEAASNLYVRTAGAAWNGKDANVATDTAITYLPQYEGPQVLATVTNKQSAQPAAGITAYFSVPGKYYQFGSAVSDSTGVVRFNLKKFADKQKILVSLGSKQQAYNISMTPFFEPQPPLKVWPQFLLPEKWAAQLQKHNLAQQVHTAFNLLPALPGKTALPDTAAFFGTPDKSYLLDDYTRFPTLEEVLREYVPEVLVRKRDNTFHYRVFNAPYGQFFDEDPLVLVDGVPVFDMDKMMAADPLKIKKLDIVTRRYAKGLDVYQGIVSFSTYGGNLEGMPLPQEARMLDVMGNLPVHEFRNVHHKELTVAGNRIPDRRLQLCWLPALQTGANGKASFSFFTSDAGGTYAIVVQGVSTSGIAGSAVHFFNVKN